MGVVAASTARAACVGEGGHEAGGVDGGEREDGGGRARGRRRGGS